MTKTSGAGSKLLIAAALLYGLHWLLVYGFSHLTFPECREDNSKYHQATCHCQTTQLGNSVIVENFLIDSITEQRRYRNKVVRQLVNINYQCR